MEQCGVENDRNVITTRLMRVFKDRRLGQGSNGTVIYEGEFPRFRRLAVKCLSEEQFNVQREGIRNLDAAIHFHNIIKILVAEKYDNFTYLAMELCDYDLRLIVEDGKLYASLLKENGHPSCRFVQLVRGIVTGVRDLHSLGIIHGNLEPSHVLILKDRVLLTGIIGSSRRLDEGKSSLEPNVTISGSIGWESPEQINKEFPQTPAMDMFNLGCVIFYIFTKGKHPFGDDLTERKTNVANNNIVNLFEVEHIYVVKDLVSQLLEQKPESRPKASEVLDHHPLFWDLMKRLWFLRDAYIEGQSLYTTTLVS